MSSSLPIDRSKPAVSFSPRLARLRSSSSPWPPAMSPSLAGSWSSALERVGHVRDRILFQVTGSGSAAASATQAERDFRSVPPCRRSSDEGGGGGVVPPERRPGTGAGGSGSPRDEDAVVAAASPGLSAETALSILVDCFGH